VYNWTLGNIPVGNTQYLSLGQTNADGIYQLTVSVNGCTSMPVSFNYQKQSLVNSYTILAFKHVTIGENNKVLSGSIGVTSVSGKASFKRNTTVSAPGSFVKAKTIEKDGSNIIIAQPIYDAATGIVLPEMFRNTQSVNNLPNKEVARNSVSTVNGNYKNLVLKKGSRTTLTGNNYGTLRVEQGAQVSFTSTVINIDKLELVKGPRYGYSYVRFAPNTKVLISGNISIGSQVYVNPDNYKVTFYLGDSKTDAENLTITGGDTKLTANVYAPGGKIRVTGGYRYGDYGNGYGDCDEDGDNEKYAGQGNSYVYMTGLFVADEINSNGKNVIWNSFDCNAAPVPVLNTITSIQSDKSATATDKFSVNIQEEGLKVTVLPNPSSTYFTLKLESKYDMPVNMRVMDSRGRVVDARSKIGANGTMRIGNEYASGTYYAEMIQGNQRKVIQLVKSR
jgi:hypothetical protein